ncbi:hypothetical protein KIW84_073484 [Lathyrus oleraceus]|uniref:Uncharacterized protein n=1 Tax=Pisum sativum TaxID=3888 RepID=A0A9D4ZYP3_PEA|nr:hypothetical protein KIW84_073484 [Pisum sativum]
MQSCHNVENCFPLKTKVQDLMRCDILSFEDSGPNVTKNPLPEHGNHLEHDHDKCRICSVNRLGCRQVRKDLQELLDDGTIEILQNRNVDEDEP